MQLGAAGIKPFIPGDNRGWPLQLRCGGNDLGIFQVGLGDQVLVLLKSEATERFEIVQELAQQLAHGLPGLRRIHAFALELAHGEIFEDVQAGTCHPAPS